MQMFCEINEIEGFKFQFSFLASTCKTGTFLVCLFAFVFWGFWEIPDWGSIDAIDILQVDRGESHDAAALPWCCQLAPALLWRVHLSCNAPPPPCLQSPTLSALTPHFLLSQPSVLRLIWPAPLTSSPLPLARHHLLS